MDANCHTLCMSTAPLPIPDADPRRAAILAAAFECFARYGFRRTAMEDIARAAGISRAALYLHYRNKPDIFRSLVQAYFDLAEVRMMAALQPGLAPERALAAAFAAKLGPEVAPLFDSPHGDELLDANFSTAADVALRGEARIAAMLTDWLQGEAAAGRIVLPGGDAAALAETMVAALGGLKQPGRRYGDLQAGLARLAQLLGRGLRP